MVFSIIIPAYTQWALTQQCLKSLAKHSYSQFPYEVLVVDNAPPRPGSPEYGQCQSLGLELFGTNFHYLPQVSNINFAGACNVGARHAKGDFLFFLNNDTVLLEPWQEKLLAALNQSQVGAAAPLLLYPDQGQGYTVQHAGIAIDPAHNPLHLHEHFPADHPFFQGSHHFQALTGAALLMPRPLFLELGGFDELFRNGYEDLDLCARLCAKGLRLILEPGVRLVHLCGQSPGRNAHSQQNRTLLAQKGFWQSLKPDLEAHVQAQGLRLLCNAWGLWQILPSKEETTRLNSLLHGPNTTAKQAQVQKALGKQPYWLEGHVWLMKTLEASGQAELALQHASKCYCFASGPEILLPSARLALNLGQDKALDYARKILHALVQPPRENHTPEYLQFLQDLAQQSLLDGPPLSGAPYFAWQSLVEAPRNLAWEKSKKLTPENPLVQPFFSLLLPVCDPEPKHLEELLDCILAQTFANWELCIVDDASRQPEVLAILQAKAAACPKIRLHISPHNQHISLATNHALSMAQAPWLVFVDHDDTLAPLALDIMAQAIAKDAQHSANEDLPPAQVFFSDDDRLCEQSGQWQRISPCLKPGFDPDLLLVNNCIAHLCVCSTQAVKNVGGLRPGFEGAQDHDLMLRLLHHKARFVHVPHVLYNWRQHAASTSTGLEAKPYAVQAAIKAKQEFLQLQNIQADVEQRPNSLFSRILFRNSQKPLLSLIFPLIPHRAEEQLQVLVAWQALMHWPKSETLIVPLGWNQDQSALLSRLLRKFPTFRPLPPSVHFTDAMNSAVQAISPSTAGNVAAFITAASLPQTAWAKTLLPCLLRPGIGFASSRLQSQEWLVHSGMAIGKQAAHVPLLYSLSPAHQGLHQDSPGYYQTAHVLHSALALYPDCLLVQVQNFQAIGGFRHFPAQNLAHAAILSCADICLRAFIQHGLRSVVSPESDRQALEKLQDSVIRQSLHALPAPCPITPDFNTLWASTLQAPPWQHPDLLACPGGWQWRPNPAGVTVSP